ncbi:hypothetical protein GGF50DRAFT_68615, partial [Schizophyllum commune]
MSSLDDPTCFRQLELVHPRTCPYRTTPLDLMPVPSTMGGVVRSTKGHRRARPYSNQGGGAADDDNSAPMSTVITPDSASILRPPRPEGDSADSAGVITCTTAERILAVNISNDMSAARAPLPSTTQSRSSGADHHRFPTTLKERTYEIARPPGKPGRPNSGGYTLETTLQWAPNLYKEIKNWVNVRVDRDLDPWTPPSKECMKHICEEAMQTKNMEFLSIYEDCWPIEELIKARLTYRK